ncbi:MAG: hypothetical protein ACOX6T_10975 [Myxococcales bacterium]|jgi:hypothetical protein
MRRSLTILLLVSLPATALGMPWKGITPGKSTEKDVIEAFGEPAGKVPSGKKRLLVYKADRTISGTTQAQFAIGEKGVVEEITLFPATQLELPEIEDTFGKACSEQEKPTQPCYRRVLTEDFRTSLWYKEAGLVVFLNPDKKTVFGLLYREPVVESVRKATAAAGAK